MNSDSEMLKEALACCRRGWSVVPVQPHGKEPIVSWAKYNKERATLKQIREWWERYPNANVGVITGRISGLVVIDVDRKGRSMLSRLPHTPLQVETRKGNFHLYYQHPGGHVPNAVNVQGLDIRADGGLVVVPPSIHATGRRYRWKRRNFHKALPFPPMDIVKTDRQREIGTSVPKDNDSWLSQVLMGVSHGGRNDAATRLAGYYFKKGMPIDLVQGQMELWNIRNDPPMSVRELTVVVQSIHKKNAEAMRNSATAPTPLVDSDGDTITDPFSLMSMDSYMERFGDEEVTWTIEDWLPDRTVAMMVAPPGSFKTWVELDAAVSVASGRPFLGTFPVKRTGPVIIVQQEDFHGAMAERMGLMTFLKTQDLEAGMPDDERDHSHFEATLPPSLPIYLHPDRRLRFSDSIVMEELEEKIKAIRPVLVIIDPLYSAGDTDDYLAKTVNQMFALKTLRDRYGCSFLIAHHTSKNSNAKDGKATEPSRDQSWGSQFVNAFLESGWQIRKVAEKVLQVKRHFKVSEDKPDIFLTMSISTKPPYSYVIESRTTREQEENEDRKRQAEVDLLDLFENRTSLGIREMASKLGQHRSTTLRRAERLVTERVLTKNEDGTYSIMTQGLW